MAESGVQNLQMRAVKDAVIHTGWPLPRSRAAGLPRNRTIRRSPAKGSSRPEADVAAAGSGFLVYPFGEPDLGLGRRSATGQKRTLAPILQDAGPTIPV